MPRTNPAGVGLLELERQRDQRTRRIHRQVVDVVTEHIQPVDVERPVVEAEVAADPVIWLAVIEDRGEAAHRRSGKPLERVSIHVERSEVQVRVIPRAHGAGGLNVVPAFGIALQIKTVGRAGINVLEA